MVTYQKYMFDNFIVSDNKADACTDNNAEKIDNEIQEAINPEEYIDETVVETTEEYDEDTAEEIQPQEDIKSEDIKQDFSPYNYEKEPEIEENIAVYTEEEFREALEQAERNAFDKGVAETQNSSLEKQNLLLEDIKNQLMTIFASLEDKKSDIEKSALEFAISMVTKLLPTLEKDIAEKEVKNFLAENFANFSSQEALSFSFNPEIIPQVADSIGRLAEQNDFEGKISVHKDETLGLSDCRVEWKSGGVKRSTSSILDKVKNLANQ